jgi:Domain of unknown function (DUF4376)
MNTSNLHDYISLLAPIHGVSIGDPDDRQTWVIQFKDDATLEQRTSAQAGLLAWSDLDLVAYAKQRRWELETGGITVGGVSVYTDDRSKLMILGARARAQSNPDLVEEWDAADGQVYPLSAAQIIAISDAVAAHSLASSPAIRRSKQRSRPAPLPRPPRLMLP